MFNSKIYFVIVLGLFIFGACVARIPAPSGRPDSPFPYHQIGDTFLADFKELSGIIFYPSRGTLFVVSDEGDLAEVSLDGALLRRVHIDSKDFEGLTLDPASGLLYLVTESKGRILEVNPETLTAGRKFKIDPMFRGQPFLASGKNHVEAIVFVPDASRSAGGTFLLAAANSTTPQEGDSLILEVEVPLQGEENDEETATIINAFSLDVTDIAELIYVVEQNTLKAISDQANLLIELTRDGQVLAVYPLPGNEQEGVTIDSNGFLYIAQDSGGIIKFQPGRVE